MKIITFIFLALLSLTSKAQQNEIELNLVTITSSLQPIPVSKTGRNIISIPGSYFDKFPVHSLDELLRYVPGVEVQQRGPAGSQADIVLRGGTFQQVLIILDGARLNDPNTGHFNSYIPIAPAEIERIEVLKGASSAVYGSEAVGGVIHVITKTFAAKNKQNRKQLNIAATAGEYKLFNAVAGANWQNKSTAIGGGFLSNNSDGQLQRGTRGYYNNNTASLSAGHYFNASWHLSVRSAYDKRKFSAQNFYTTFKSDTAKEAVESYWNQLNLTYEKAANKFIVDAGYKKAIDEFAYNSGSAANKNISTLFQVSSRYEHMFSANTSLISGFQFQNKDISSNDRGSHNLKQVAGFMILNQGIGKYFFLMPAIRVDYTENAGTEFVPQVNLSYKRKNFQFRGSAGKTIRQADFTERYNNFNKTLVTSGSIGNPNLEAERSFSYEAGADYFAGKNLKVSASVFQRRQSQLIDWVTTPYSQMPRKDNLSPAGTYALATNIAKVTTTGIETDIQFNKSFNTNNHLLSTIGFVWLDSKSSNAVPSFYISSHAKFLTNFNVQYLNKRFSVSVSGIYKNRKPQKATAINADVDADCFMLNTKLNVFLWQQKLSVFMEVDNVFNNTCGDILGTQMPGRWLMGGLKFQLK